MKNIRSNLILKSLLVFILTVCISICYSCKKEEMHIIYKTEFSYCFANPDSQAAVQQLIASYDGIWTTEREFIGRDVSQTDKAAMNQFGNSIKVINAHLNDEILPYITENDSIIYTLKRTTEGFSGVVKNVKYDINGYTPK